MQTSKIKSRRQVRGVALALRKKGARLAKLAGAYSRKKAAVPDFGFPEYDPPGAPYPYERD